MSKISEIVNVLYPKLPKLDVMRIIVAWIITCITASFLIGVIGFILYQNKVVFYYIVAMLVFFMVSNYISKIVNWALQLTIIKKLK